jgi:hydroxyacylglutathione hydrolase
VIIRQLVVGQLQTNCYIAACEKTKEGVIIDPGDEAGRILGEVESLGLKIKYILNTHAHFDHIGANEALMNRLETPLALHPLDLPILKASGGAAAFGLEAPQSPNPDMELTHDQIISVGTLEFRVLFTPGHTPGHVSFYERNSNVVFDGDVLFDGGIGRTDIPGGDSDAIIRSIKEVLFTLPAETIVYSGHGNPTTIGQEQTTNPWIGLD